MVAMLAPAYRVKRNGDASLDVWVRNLWIHFPAEGKPTVGSGPASGGAVQSDPEVTVKSGDEGTTVTCHGKVVLIKPDGSTVIVSDKPHGGPTHGFRARMRRARG